MLFNTVPFQDISPLQLPQLVKNGERPAQLNGPTMPVDDGVWNVIHHCWMQNPSKRPTMKHMVRAGMTFTSLHSLLATLSEVCASEALMDTS